MQDWGCIPHCLEDANGNARKNDVEDKEWNGRCNSLFLVVTWEDKMDGLEIIVFLQEFLEVLSSS